MKTEDIQRYQHAVPFKPYVLHLSDGRKVRVAHRDCVAFWPGNRTVVVFEEDYWDAIDLMHVVSIDDRPRRNGKSKKKPA
jgi:hypothetical protein